MPESPPMAAPAEKARPDWAFFYPSVIFLGSFLLFLLEPLYAKLILPRFGGSASVWALCLVFYQVALLLGYAYGDFLTHRLDPRKSSFLHMGLLLASLLFMPLALGSFWLPHPGSDPALLILGLLATRIGLPFVLLSSTSPLIQSWYFKSRPKAKPYLLFALSNGASLLALLSYPFLIEPHLSSSLQKELWSGFYVLFVLLCSFTAWKARASLVKAPVGGPAKPVGSTDPVRISLRDRLVWISLSACGSMLLLSVTNHLTQDVAPVPLLWVLPLSTYLLSFILVFSRREFYPRKVVLFVMPVLLLFFMRTFYVNNFKTLLANLLVFCGGLLVACLFCHGELSHRRPPARHLTTFYLMISLGGALGAILVGLGAPTFFSNLYEFPLTLNLIALLALVLLWEKGWGTRLYWFLAIPVLVYVPLNNIALFSKNNLVMVRNFYAPLRVAVMKSEKAGPYLTLDNGTICHGNQFQDPARALEPTTYYSRGSGIGLVLGRPSSAPRRVGFVGLGAGTLAAYGRAGDVFRFYEINPQVIQVAEKYFTFLSRSAAKVEMVPGDARLSMEGEVPQAYDVLVVDAFSGDSIPVHLLTREAFALYFKHLKPNGVLAIHVSNKYLNLALVVKSLADDAGYPSFCVENKEDEAKLVSLADWILVTKDPDVLQDPACRAEAVDLVLPAGLVPWTDDFNSLFSIMRKDQ